MRKCLKIGSIILLLATFLFVFKGAQLKCGECMPRTHLYKDETFLFYSLIVISFFIFINNSDKCLPEILGIGSSLYTIFEVLIPVIKTGEIYFIQIILFAIPPILFLLVVCAKLNENIKHRIFYKE